MTSFLPVRPPTMKPGEPLGNPIIYFEDFIGAFTAVDLALASESDPTGMFSPVADRGAWLLSFDATDAVTQLPAPQDNAHGGWISMTTDATSGERICAQLNGEMFKIPTKQHYLYFETRVRFDTTTQDFFMGLSVNTTDPHASKPADAIAFLLSGDADLEYLAAKDAGDTTANDTGTDIVADVWTVLAFEYSGGAIRFYKDGLLVATVKDVANIPDDEEMSPVFCIESNGAAEKLDIDYILVINSRA